MTVAADLGQQKHEEPEDLLRAGPRGRLRESSPSGQTGPPTSGKFNAKPANTLFRDPLFASMRNAKERGQLPRKERESKRRGASGDVSRCRMAFRLVKRNGPTVDGDSHGQSRQVAAIGPES